MGGELLINCSICAQLNLEIVHVVTLIDRRVCLYRHNAYCLLNHTLVFAHYYKRNNEHIHHPFFHQTSLEEMEKHGG